MQSDTQTHLLPEMSIDHDFAQRAANYLAANGLDPKRITRALETELDLDRKQARSLALATAS